MYVEDYLELLAGLSEKHIEKKFFLHSRDQTLINSLARQTFQATPLTDRQHELTKRKLLEYKEQFDVYSLTNLEEDLDTLRMPLREIDRSKTVTIANIDDELCIAVRFPFSKKMIKHIDFLQSLQHKKQYDKRSKTHFLPFSDSNVFSVVGRLIDCNFVIEKKLNDFYRILTEMDDNKENYAPGIYGLTIKNLHDKAIDYAISAIGEPSIENLAAYKDRENILGLKHFDDIELQRSIANLQPLTKRIVSRSKTSIYINNKEFTFNNIVESILELYRLPVAIVLPKGQELDGLVDTHKSFQNIIYDDNISVLFRLDNDDEEGYEFNSYVKKNKLNSPLDKDTKIVYINNNKLPKPLITSNWLPEVTILYGNNRTSTNVQLYLNNCDLIIHYTDVDLPWGKQDIEKI
tara:strand:- start:234 stop:1448 length:1215 start_codon:yes stop_codon:yes gene_type:complete